MARLGGRSLAGVLENIPDDPNVFSAFVTILLSASYPSGFAVPILAGEAFLDGGNVQSRNCYAAVVVKPNDNAAASGIKSNVIGRSN